MRAPREREDEVGDSQLAPAVTFIVDVFYNPERETTSSNNCRDPCFLKAWESSAMLFGCWSDMRLEETKYELKNWLDAIMSMKR